MHGTALAAGQYWKKSRRKLPRGVAWLLTLLWVNAAFVVFRSPTLGAAGELLGAMIPHGDVLGTATLETVLPLTPTIVFRPVVLGVVLAVFFKSSAERADAFTPTFQRAMATAALLVVSLFFINSSVAKQFVYFAF